MPVMRLDLAWMKMRTGSALPAAFFSWHGARAAALSYPSTLSPASTPAKSILDLSFFVLGITGAIFAVVTALLIYVIVRYRQRGSDDDREPAQVYGSNQVELAWTVVPVL